MNNIPLFPEFVVEKENEIYTFKSNFHVHKDLEDTVRVYLYPVTNKFIIKNKTAEKQASLVHLKECFRLSKYINTDKLDFMPLEFVISLNKDVEDFLEKIHYQYP
jgi:hypothetical protein